MSEHIETGGQNKITLVKKVEKSATHPWSSNQRRECFAETKTHLFQQHSNLQRKFQPRGIKSPSLVIWSPHFHGSITLWFVCPQHSFFVAVEAVKVPSILVFPESILLYCHGTKKSSKVFHSFEEPRSTCSTCSTRHNLLWQTEFQSVCYCWVPWEREEEEREKTIPVPKSSLSRALASNAQRHFAPRFAVPANWGFACQEMIIGVLSVLELRVTLPASFQLSDPLVHGNAGKLAPTVVYKSPLRHFRGS